MTQDKLISQDSQTAYFIRSLVTALFVPMAFIGLLLLIYGWSHDHGLWLSSGGTLLVTALLTFGILRIALRPSQRS
ncbi:MAG: hypothetical protein LPK80_07765 [Bacteroidota bacterium]|nr:hypothetical protein [Bacteroidota bacterium]MDX5447052.1 hypothetical protein [Bacteroidota bacterium]